MVSWLPWRGDTSSTASFEKTLSTLSVKIADSQARLEKARASSRRVKVLVTLYLGFAYLVYSIVVFLVIGANELGQLEWAGVITGPFLVFGIRKTLSAIFNYRMETLSTRLNEQQKERAKTIQKLKDATKYDSTLELIEKYGGSDGKSRTKGHEDEDNAGTDGDKAKKQRHSNVGPMPGRTTMPPPPTANIQRHDPSTPGSTLQQSPRALGHDPMEPTAEFAPNAGAPSSERRMPSDHIQDRGFNPAPATYESGHWYDRIFDVLLGEDETAPKNRIALICQSCRTVNGQAPPGTRSLAELGLWRCMSCGASNGVEEEDAGKRIVREVLGNAREGAETITPAPEEVSDDDQAEVEMQLIGEEAGDGPAASVRKRRAKSK
ncbi:hypothetical protein CC79DRAFT_1322638 [Sarocladium strictum]